MMHRGDGDYDEEVERDMMMRKKRGRAGGVEEEVRMFRLSVDVRSFKAGLRLPMKAINACVRVFLPPQIVKLALSTPNSANAAKLTAPIRTHPPVIIQKGSEVALSNGSVPQLNNIIQPYLHLLFIYFDALYIYIHIW